jgi:hypothetical protein
VNEIQSTVLQLLPSRKKQTPSGWISFDAVCCHHRGQTRDSRKRGGILTNSEGGFQYHCFNCDFKTGWTPGKLLSNNAKQLFKWLGLTEQDLGRLNLIALKIKDNQPTIQGRIIDLTLKEIALPEDSDTLFNWATKSSEVDDSLRSKLIDTIEYIIDRGFDPYNSIFHWSPSIGYQDRVIIPFYQDGNIVGYTGRKITEGKPKYLTESQPGYVFNIDRQNRDRQFVIVVEGQFDALAIDGVAIMTNEPSDTQVLRINALTREVICVPDRDRAGSKLLNCAIKNNWTVSLPPWEDDVKDVADAMKRYGRLYTLATILHYKQQGEIKIQLLKKKLETLND